MDVPGVNIGNVQNATKSGRALRFMVAGGGTGGHIFPAIAIANAIKQQQPNAQFLFVGAKGKMEMEKVPQAGYEIKGLDIAGFNRSSLIKNIGLPFKIIKSFFQVRKIINDFKPDAVIGVGGYSSFPVLKTAQGKGIPTFIHESNAFAGKANMMLGKKATKVFTAAEGMQKFFPAEKILVTGNPVRKNITENNISNQAGKAFFGLDAGKTTILSVGGSLGARTINEAVEAGVETLSQQGLQLIWQTGKLFGDRAKNAAGGKKGIWVNEFISEMDKAYAAADVIISRAGAMSVAEICIAGKPVVFVPFPYAAEDHQTANAKALVDREAAVLIKDSEAATALIPTVLKLAADERWKQVLRHNIQQMAVKDADEVIATEILKSL